MKKNKATPLAIARAKARSQREWDRFMSLSDAEKTKDAEATARMISRPLTPGQEAMLVEEGMIRRPGRPVRGQGAQQISVSMERSLLRRADEFARRHGISRAQLIASGLELALAKAS